MLLEKEAHIARVGKEIAVDDSQQIAALYMEIVVKELKEGM